MDKADAKFFYNRAYNNGTYGASEKSCEDVERLEAFIDFYNLHNKKIVEIGCGKGDFQYLVKDWVGLDLAFAVQEFIKKPFIVASAEDLPVKNESFDAVITVDVLEHIVFPERALGEIARILKPGGVAYIAPEWHCRSWAAGGYNIRPWQDFGLKGRLIKLSIFLRDRLWFRALYAIPLRIFREVFYLISRRPLNLCYNKLKPNYEVYWASDSDTCSSLDPHEMLLWFSSRGWKALSHSGWMNRFLVRHGAIIVQKPIQ